MSGCMQTDKPLISIVMAVYEPRMDWLAEQLLSLNAQTYPNLELNILDDCSPTVPFEEIRTCVEHCITAFPFTLERNEENLGSNLTFERLTNAARGEYIAYCDQDDVWLPKKLSRLHQEMQESGALLCCSDMYIIDGAGRQTADSITKVRRHHLFQSGEGLAPQLVFHNWVTGCTMLVRKAAAQGAVPFCPYMVHDQYLALYCASKGRIDCLQEPLIRYRIHGNNQTGVMTGVTSKEQYLELRIREVEYKLEWLSAHFSDSDKALRSCFDDGLRWVRARENNLRRRGGAWDVWRYRRFGPRVSLFELFAPWMPESIFLLIIHLARKNYI